MGSIVRKGEIACYKQFLRFLTMFSTAIYIYVMHQNVALCCNGLKKECANTYPDKLCFANGEITDIEIINNL